MKKLILIFVVAQLATTQVYSQCVCCAGAGAGSSTGVYNNGILTLPKNQWIIEGYGDYRTVKNGDAPEEEEKLLQSMVISSLGVRYGLNDKLTLSALLPYVFLHTNYGNDKGIGDMILMGTYNLFSKKNFKFAVQAGLELPTGIRKASNFDNTTIVVGSGSYDPMIGILFSKNWDKLTLTGNALYKNTIPGFDNNYYGDVSTQNLALSYKIKTSEKSIPMEGMDANEMPHFEWNIFSGYYGEWVDKIKEDNVVDENSGYYSGFVNVGTYLSYKKWSFPLTISLPIINYMNGNQNDSGYRIRLGIIRSL